MRPPIVRAVINGLADLDTLLTHPGTFPARGGGNGHNVAREFVQWATSGYEEFRGLEPGHNGTLDLLTIGVSSRLTRSGKPQRAGTASLDGVQQQWLRDLLVTWLLAAKPPSTEFRAMLKSCVMASTALALRPGGGHDPRSLGVADMDAVVDLLRKRATTLHIGPANFCWFSDPTKALCLRLAGTPEATRPLVGMCDSARCPQATHHPHHRTVWADQATQTQVLLGNPRVPKGEKTRLAPELNRALRVLAEIDAAARPEDHDAPAE
jgi:hypothetical protein